MIFCRLTKKIAFLTLLLINASFASDKLEGMGNFKVLPKPLQKYILLDLLSPEDIDVLRVGSKGMKKFIDDDYEEKLRKEFGNNEKSVLKDLLSDNPKITIAPSKNHYTHKIMQKICEEYLKKDGFLCTSQGSYLEGYLSQNYKSVPFYDYLETQPTVMTQFFNILFKKNIAEGKEGLALNFLTGCLPFNHIYVEKEREEMTSFLEKVMKILLDSLENNKIKYFLLGIDRNFDVLEDKKHVIVINQSDLNDLNELENFPHETIILNADQVGLVTKSLPKKLKNLILVNGNHKCSSIEWYFLNNHEGLQVCIPKGLSKVKIINGYFLSGCKSLRTFNATGLPCLHIITYGFLDDCKNLSSFESIGLINLEIIGSFFLSNCTSLSNFDTTNFRNVKKIKDYFLYWCTDLRTFSGKGLRNLEEIGNFFLSNCRKLHTFNSSGLINVQTIGYNFLAECSKLDGKKIKEEILRKKK